MKMMLREFQKKKKKVDAEYRISCGNFSSVSELYWTCIGVTGLNTMGPEYSSHESYIAVMG